MPCIHCLLVHKLCHPRQPHHGRRFWRLLDASWVEAPKAAPVFRGERRRWVITGAIDLQATQSQNRVRRSLWSLRVRVGPGRRSRLAARSTGSEGRGALTDGGAGRVLAPLEPVEQAELHESDG